MLQDLTLLRRPYAYAGNNPIMATDPDGLRLLYYTRPLMRGTDVQWVQYQLMLAGFGWVLAPYGVDCVFGRQTQMAVAHFQAHVAIVIDGIVGPQTLNALASHNGFRVPPGETPGQHPMPADPAPADPAPSTPGPRDVTDEFNAKLRKTYRRVRKFALKRHALGVVNLHRLAKFAKYAYFSINDKHNAKYNAGVIFNHMYVKGADLGNFRFGYAGRAANISFQFLTTGGGLVQITEDIVKRSRRDVKRDLKYIRNRFERPEDIRMAKKGFRRYKKDHGPGDPFFNELDAYNSVKYWYNRTRI